MELEGKRILMAANYAANYKGNFMSSLEMLEAHLRDGFKAECAYLLPDDARRQPWIGEFSREHKVYFSGHSLRDGLGEVLEDFKPDIVYSHFDGYDLALYYELGERRDAVRQVWHKHNAMVYHRNPVKALYQRWYFFSHYGLPFLRPKVLGGGIKPCMIVICGREARFARRFRLWKKIEETLIPNGISLERVNPRPGIPEARREFTFLAFGGRNAPKRTDYLVEASKRLTREGVAHRVVIIGAPAVEQELFRLCGELPENVSVVGPREDINSVFAMGDCFVSTSVHETFSYAIAEAAYYGLPVIQSRIEGTRWSESLPASFPFPSRDVEALVRTMKAVMATPAVELEERCRRSSDSIAAEYSLGAWADKVIGFFKRMK